MKKTKKLLAALALSLAVTGGATVFAQTICFNDYTLHYQYDNSTSYSDSYVTAINSGTIREDHSYTSGSYGWSYTAKLMLRTAWYQPNQLRDTSSHLNGYNSTSCSSGQQFRTDVTATGAYLDSTGVHSYYTN